MQELDSEFDIDDIMEMIDEAPEDESIIDEAAKEEDRPEPVKSDDSKDAKLAYEALNNNLQLKQENEALRAAKDEAEKLALQGAIRNFESQIDFAQSDISKLNQELVRARDEGDNAASIEIESRLRDQYERIRDLKGKVEQYSPYLNAPKQSSNQSAPAGLNQMATEWLKENESWLTDSKHQEKRAYADNLFKEMSNSGMNMNNLGFWTKLEKSLVEYDLKKTQDNKQRMPKNMVTYNSNNSNSNNSKKASYKTDPEFLKRVAYLAKHVIKNEDILTNKEMLNSTLKHYHKVWKSGGFKYMPVSSD